MSMLQYNISEKHLQKTHHRFMFLIVIVFASWMFGTVVTSTIMSLTSVNTTTTVTVSNSGPTFSSTPAESPASTGTNPTNVGSNVTFIGTGTDINGDHYYLAVCKTDSVTPNTNAAPSCASSQTLCVSGSTISGTQATCNYTAVVGDLESVDWYAFVCDHSSGSLCSPSSQGSSDSGSPFKVNHKAIFTSLTPGSAVDPGQDMSFSAVGQDDDIDTTQDSVHLIVCSVSGATSSGCTNPANQLCSSSNVTNDPSCNYSTPSVFARGSHNYYAYLFDQHGLGSASNPKSGTYTINNMSPSLSNIDLNSGNPINLTVSTTTAVHFTFRLTDYNGYGDIASTSAKLYRTGVGSGAADSANNHYTVTSCTLSNQSGASADYNCTFNVLFHADPTDVSNTQYYTDNWTSTATLTDGGSLQATSSATPVELNSLLGITVNANIDYGSMVPGGNTGSTNQEIIISSVGNTGLDTLIQGTSMTDGNGNYIPVENQKYDLASFTYNSGGTVLSGSDVLLALHVTKTITTGLPGNKNIYWGIEIPSVLSAGNYSGTNTITAEVSDIANW